jgi:Protein of unknown function (DUF1364).
MRPCPKSPASRSHNLRQLANGETCAVCMGGKCDPATTVWAHTNTLSDNKGMGYKGDDAAGFFAGYVCHALIDQGRMQAHDKAALVAQAQHNTRKRLEQIADDPLTREWKRKAARWALEQLQEAV